MRDLPDRMEGWGRPAGAPLLVLCDLASQSTSIWSASPDFVEKLTTVVARARRSGVAIAYCEKVGFEEQGWPAQLQGCRPTPPDRIFVRSAASCFSNQDFSAAAAEHDDSGLFIAGLDAARGVLATAIDADALGIRLGVLTDLCGDSGALTPLAESALLATTILLHWFAMDRDTDALFGAGR